MILENKARLMIKFSIHFEFEATNNQTNKEVVIAGLTLASEMGEKNIKMKINSQLIVS